jgi:hypothetical protein
VISTLAEAALFESTGSGVVELAEATLVSV